MSRIAGNIHSRRSRWGFLGVLALLAALACPAFGQNTKGDRPAVKNQRQVRETNAKGVKKKEKGRTRDIANRRLRTKDKSSASRANASLPQPNPYAGRKSRAERAASPRGRVFSKSPRESKVRAWRGDVSKYPLRRVHPTNSDAARSNVYPQKGPYVRYARKQPKAKPPVYKETVRGNPFIRHEPRYEERAWKGGADNKPIRNKSATGKTKNTYSQDSPYVAYYNKRKETKDKPVSNKEEVSRAKRFSRRPLTGGSEPTYSPNSASSPFIQRGKKNVYWGKIQKKERAHTGDLTGAPLRTRNYKSMPAGLVGRDTVKFFGRRPHGDRAIRPGGGGYPTATKRGQRGWKGDVAGWPLRAREQGKYNRQKALKPTEPGEGAFSLSKVFNWQFRGVKPKDRVPDTREARFQGNIRSEGKVFSDQGAGYSGNIRRGTQPGFGKQGAGYSGNIRRGTQPGFSKQGAGYSGNIKSQGASKVFGDQGAGYSGNIRRGTQPGFSRQGAGYSGNIKSQGASKVFGDQGAGYSGNIKRGRQEYSRQGAGYSGNIKSQGASKVFGDQGAGYSGNIKRGRQEYGRQGAGYSGDMRSQGAKVFEDQGEEFTGYLKASKPKKGGGTVSGVLWNNDNSAIAGKGPAGGEGAKAANFSGKVARSRFKKDYVQNPNSYKLSLKKHAPDATTYKVAGLQVKVKENDTKRKPNANKDGLPGIAPSRSTVKASEYSRNMKMHWDYKRNPNSDDRALKVAVSGKADGRVGDFQGNSKMHNYKGAKLHPDAQFAHSYRDNVKEERTMLMSVKLLWGKLFRKSETQPSNLKDNSRRPGYDKREKDLWAK